MTMYSIPYLVEYKYITNKVTQMYIYRLKYIYIAWREVCKVSAIDSRSPRSAKSHCIPLGCVEMVDFFVWSR